MDASRDVRNWREAAALEHRLTLSFGFASGNHFRSSAMLTSAQSQGTNMASTVARGRKI